MVGRQAQITALVLATYMAVALQIFIGLPNPDLATAWAAAELFRAGEAAGIYGAGSVPFDTLARGAHAERLEALGYAGESFAYIYPPLWIALLAPLTGLIGLDTFLAVVTVLNCALVPAMVLLAWRATESRLPAPAFLLIGLAALLATPVGALGLFQNQVQIAVCFLILLAADRSRAGAGAAAGAALALASALKLYPVLLVVIWIARRDRRALLSFALTGGGLGLLSIALAGWPLHSAFLSQIAAVSGTLLTSPGSVNLPAILAALGAGAPLTLIDYGTGQVPGLAVGPMPTWLGLLLKTGLVLVLLLLWRASHAVPQGVLWAVGAGAISLLTSVSWSFHYMAVLAVAPWLIDRFGPWRGGATLGLTLLPMSYLLIPVWRDLGPGPQLIGVVTTLAMIALIAALCRGLTVVQRRVDIEDEAAVPGPRRRAFDLLADQPAVDDTAIDMLKERGVVMAERRLGGLVADQRIAGDGELKP